LNHLNSDSLTINKEAVLEPSLADAQVGDQMQFERIGYFRVDEDSTPRNLVFNRTITLRDNWAKK
jgi:glutaminyl-tRNA synthetase